MRRYVQILAVAALAVLVPRAIGRDTKDTGEVALDKDFVAKVAACSHLGEKLSEVASKQASNNDVKGFARRVLKEHKVLDEKLMEAAKDTKVAVVTGTDPEQRKELTRISKLDGAAFDRAYMKRMIEGHEQAIKMFEAQAKQGKNAELSRFATDTLPALREHLKVARTVAKELGGND
jgi:putative membrane protein